MNQYIILRKKKMNNTICTTYAIDAIGNCRNAEIIPILIGIIFFVDLLILLPYPIYCIIKKILKRIYRNKEVKS
jgi:hypothetical protein